MKKYLVILVALLALTGCHKGRTYWTKDIAPQEIEAVLRGTDALRVVVAMSGDTGFFSGAKKLLPREWDYPTFSVVEAKPISRERTRRDAAMTGSGGAS